MGRRSSLLPYLIPPIVIGGLVAYYTREQPQVDSQPQRDISVRWLFQLDDNGLTPCVASPYSDVSVAHRAVNGKYRQQCDITIDSVGVWVFTCTELPNAIVTVAPDQGSCERIRTSTSALR